MRRSLLVLVGLSVLFGLVVGLAILFRLPIAQAIVENRLAAMGIPGAEVTLSALGPREARLSALILGDEQELTADRVSLRYDLAQFRLSEPLAVLQQITVERPILRLDLTGEGPPLGSLQSALTRGGTPSQPSFAFPPTTLRQARIAAETPLGPATLELHGSLTPEADGRASARLSLVAEGAVGHLSASLTAAVSPNGAAQGRLTIEEGAFRPADRAVMPVTVDSLTGSLRWRLENWQPAALSGRLSLGGLAHPIGLGDSASLAFDLTGQRARVEGKLLGTKDSLEAKLALRLEDYLEAPRMDLTIDGTAEAAVLPSEPLGLPPAASGKISLRMKLWGDLAPFKTFGEAPLKPVLGPATLRPLLAWLSSAHLGARAEVSLAELALPGLASGVNIDLATRGSLKYGELRLALDRDASLSFEGVAPDWSTVGAVPPALRPLLEAGGSVTIGAQGEPATALRLAPVKQGLSLRLAGTADIGFARPDASPLSLSGIGQFDLTRELRLASLRAETVALSAPSLPLAGLVVSDLSLRGRITGTPAALTGRVDVTGTLEAASVAGLRLTEARLRLPLAFETADRVLTLTLDEAGQISAAQLAGDGVAVAQPAATMSKGGIALASSPTGRTVRIAPDIVLEPAAFDVTLRGQAEQAQRVALTLGTLTVTSAEGADGLFHVALQPSKAALDDPALAIDGLTGKATFDAALSELSARFATAIRSTAESPPVAPLSLSGTLRRNETELRVAAEATPVEVPTGAERPRFALTARYDPQRGRGEIVLPETTLTFAPGGLQPRHLLPAMAALANVAGEATLAAKVTLGQGASAGKAQLSLKQLDFRSGTTTVSDLDLSLVLDSLQPPRSPPAQQLTAARLDGVLPLDSIDATFQLLAAAPLEIKVERLSFRLADGEFLLRDTVLAPSRPRQELTFDVTGVDLARLFEILSVEGLTGSGVLDGRLPLLIEGQDVGIKQGKLETRGPGVLSYRSEALQSSLPPDADDLTLLQSPVDLAIEALANFHYDSLTMELDKTIEGETTIALHIEGKNPDLLGGYPFIFNINLKGNLNPLIAALRQGATLSEEMIRRTWKATP